MERTNKLQTPLILLSLLAVAWLFSGCAVMIDPHTTERLGEVRGRVLDAQTHQPIKGAKVYFCEPPEHATYTDADGYFLMKPTKNTHWLSGAGGSGYPNRKSNGLCISHPNYSTKSYWEGYGQDPMNIQLKPNLLLPNK